MIDPFSIKRHSKFHPFRLAWTAYSRAIELYSHTKSRPVATWTDVMEAPNVKLDRGQPLHDTAVTSAQADLLEKAVRETELLGGAIVELGCYRGVTTERIAALTSRPVFAVDPYIGYGGWEADMEAMRSRTHRFSHVHHVRLPSGAAAAELTAQDVSFVFIDAVHDFSNTSFDFYCWMPLIIPGGLVAMHDVDDFAGTNYALRRILARQKGVEWWGYCPNLAILRKTEPQAESDT